MISLNANLSTTNSGEGSEIMRLADRKVIMDIWAEISGKASTQSWVMPVRRANVMLKHVNGCKEISSGRLLFLVMVFTSRIIDFMKGKYRANILYNNSFYFVKSIISPGNKRNVLTS
jgi:hypothetical protein